MASFPRSTLDEQSVFEKDRYESKPCIQNLLNLYCSRCDAEHCIVIRRWAGFAKQGVLVGHFVHVLAAVYTRSRRDIINQLKDLTRLSPPPRYSQLPSLSANMRRRNHRANIHVVLLIQRRVRHRLFFTDAETQAGGYADIYQAMMHALCKMTCQNCA